MELAKAREILKDHLLYWKDQEPPDYHDALKLHIEAATFIILSRVTTPGSVPTLLAGETDGEPPPTREEVKKYLADQASR